MISLVGWQKLAKCSAMHSGVTVHWQQPLQRAFACRYRALSLQSTELALSDAIQLLLISHQAPMLQLLCSDAPSPSVEYCEQGSFCRTASSLVRYSTFTADYSQSKRSVPHMRQYSSEQQSVGRTYKTDDHDSNPDCNAL